MRTSFLGLPCWLFLIHFAASQESDTAVDSSPSVVIADPETGATPESPVTAAQKLVIEFEDVLETKVHDLGDRQITTQKIAPIELPPIPAPPPPPDPLDPAVQARIQALREKYVQRTFVLISATVYRSAAFSGRSRTRLTLQGEKGGLVTGWSSADWELLGGVSGFADPGGRKYGLIMTHGNIDLDRWSEFASQRGGTFQQPAIPSLPAGDATFVVTSGNLSPDSLVALGELHDLYNTELESLKARRKARYEAHLAREEELRLNPPPPKDIVIRHWRMDEAGQQGIPPKPAVTR